MHPPNHTTHLSLGMYFDSYFMLNVDVGLVEAFLSRGKYKCSWHTFWVQLQTAATRGSWRQGDRLYSSVRSSYKSGRNLEQQCMHGRNKAHSHQVLKPQRQNYIRLETQNAMKWYVTIYVPKMGIWEPLRRSRLSDSAWPPIQVGLAANHTNNTKRTRRGQSLTSSYIPWPAE